MSAYQSCSNCGGRLDAALHRCPACGAERVQGRLARRRNRPAVRVAGWVITALTAAAFVIGTVGGFLYRSGYPGGGLSAGGVQLQPLPLPAASTGRDDPWAAVLRVQPQEAGGSREGTGFFIDQSGHLVTAAHVVEGGRCVTLFDRNGRTFEGAVLGLDRLLDIALVRVATPGAPHAHLSIADTEQPGIGQKVAVAHLVTGNEPIAQTGEVRSVGTAMTIDGRHLQNLFELKGVDAVAGMSGGPVVDPDSGDAVGLLVAGTDAGGGYAMPFTDSSERLREWATLPTPSGCTRPAASTQTALQLVTITPLSGLLGVWGADVADGVALAVQEMEAELQKVGYRVTIRQIDDGGDPAKARELAAMVAADPQVIGLVGSLTNPLGEAVHTGIADSQKVHIIPATPAERPAPQSEHPVFRLVPSVQEQMTALAGVIRQQRPVGTVVLLDDGTALGRSRIELFEPVAIANRFTILDRVSLSPDLTAEQLVARLNETSPDLVYYGGGAGPLRGVLSAIGGRPWMLAGGAELADRGFETLPHAATEGMLFPYPVTAPPVSFTARFESARGRPTAGLSAYGYDGAMLILEALAAWGKENPGQVPTGQELSDRIAARTRYQGVTGRIGFGPNGENGEALIPIYRWSGGALQPITSIE